MSEERLDPKQVAAFRALARHIADAKSEQKFEDALRRLMTPSPEEPSENSSADPAETDPKA